MGNPCASLQQQVSAIQSQILAIQAAPGYIQGPHDPHPGRPDPESLAQVKALLLQSEQKSGALRTCELEHGGKPDLSTHLVGQATLTTTDSSAKGPFTQNVSIGLLFHEFDHTIFDVTSFPAIVVGPFSTPVGNNTTTISLTGSVQGTFNPTSGSLSMKLPLHFHESLLVLSDSNLTITLSTETLHPAGSRLNAAGHLTLTGSAIFQSGVLGGDVATLTVAGTIAPRP